MTQRKKQPNAVQILELIERAQSAQNLEELARFVLPSLAEMLQSQLVFLYLADPQMPSPVLFHHGCEPELQSELKDLCDGYFTATLGRPDTVSLSEPPVKFALYPLQVSEKLIGLIGLTIFENGERPDHLEYLFRILANLITQLKERASAERQIAHLNTYLTISSLIAQPLGLHELLEAALYACMAAVSAEASSVLLLDEEEENFRFYNVEGPAKPVLGGATFPADRGLAGHVLQTQQSEVINDVANDPRFYQRIDSESGFQTRNMIAIPLTASEKHVGVLEVLNKVGEDLFTEDEHLLLLSVADEIALAIRNTMVFEYVVNSYCKQRQGLATCRGCERPLGLWTPCVKYREAEI